MAKDIEARAIERERKKQERAQQRAEQEAQRKADKERAKQEARALRNAEQAEHERDIWQEITNNANNALQVHKAKRGRPRIMTQEQKDEILVRMANGQPLSAICRMDNMPDITVVYDEIKRDASFAHGYARARENMTHTILYDTLVIADDESGDIIENEQTGEKTVNHAKIQRDKVRIDTRFRVAGKVNHQYADKAPAMAIGDGASVTVNAVTVSGRDLSPDDRQKLRDMLMAARAEQAKLIEQ